MVARSEAGRRCGESHPRARVPDSVVRAVRDAHEIEGMGLRRLAKRFGLPRATIQAWCSYTRRAVRAESWHRVEAKP